VVAWLPQRRLGEHTAALRRLHVGAVEHGTPVFMLRPAVAQHEASAAPLRLVLQDAACTGAEFGEGLGPEAQAPSRWPGGAATLGLHILKRRGPPLAAPLQLRAQPDRLALLLAARHPHASAGCGLLRPWSVGAHALAGAASAH
jgi:protein ImuA